MAIQFQRSTVRLLSAGLLAVTLAACSDGSRRPERRDENVSAPSANEAMKDAETKQISILSFKYVPETLTVAPGTKVTWTNQDDMAHTVTSTTKPRALDSAGMDTDDSFSYVFNEPGTYDYLCALHPQMRGRVIVEKP